jgi:hypothetical protein
MCSTSSPVLTGRHSGGRRSRHPCPAPGTRQRDTWCGRIGAVAPIRALVGQRAVPEPLAAACCGPSEDL